MEINSQEIHISLLFVTILLSKFYISTHCFVFPYIFKISLVKAPTFSVKMILDFEKIID